MGLKDTCRHGSTVLIQRVHLQFGLGDRVITEIRRTALTLRTEHGSPTNPEDARPDNLYTMSFDLERASPRMKVIRSFHNLAQTAPLIGAVLAPSSILLDIPGVTVS